MTISDLAVAVGKFITVEGGYPIAYWGGHAVTVTSPEEARQAVVKIIDAGPDVIKTTMESGNTLNPIFRSNNQFA